MTTLPIGIPFSEEEPGNSVKRTLVAVPVDRGSNPVTEHSSEEWQIQLRSLQQLICELLMKNQELRRAIMEMKELEPIADEGNV